MMVPRFLRFPPATDALKAVAGTATPQHRPGHAWTVERTCDAPCQHHVQEPAGGFTVERGRVATRAGAFGAALVSIGAAVATPDMLARRSRRLLRTLGIEEMLIDDRRSLIGIPPAESAASPSSSERRPRGTLVVAPHVSWVDVPALLTLGDPRWPGPFSGQVRFVARADAVTAPMIGRLVRRAGTIAHHRGCLASLQESVAEVTRLLAAGDTVVVFPESTTYCGHHYGDFRPAFFQAAIDADAVIQPVELRYLTEEGHPTARAAFVGEEHVGYSWIRLARRRRTAVEIRLCSPISAATARGRGAQRRKDLARRAEAAIRGLSPLPSRQPQVDGATAYPR